MDININDIINDIYAFCDPFTDPKVKGLAGKKRVDIIRNARNLSFDIDTTSGRISSRHRRGEFSNIKSLLASQEFADIKRFAETQKRLFERTTQSPTIPSDITLNGKRVSAQSLANSLETHNEKVSLTLLDGPAGVGKTFQIRQLAKFQCEKCVSDSSTPPVLHISSGGRRLSNFKDVLAATTQDMAACFNGKQVPILVRHGLLIAAVDGFDELVDADGYEDSWKALKDFIEEVRQGGLILLAARDTFLDEQELLSRIEVSREHITLSMGHIHPVNIEDAIKFLSNSPQWSKEDIESDITSDILFEGSYALRPFFLNLLREAKGWNDIEEQGFRTYLVKNLLAREATIISKGIKDTDHATISSALINLFQEIALEMAERENNLIEIEHLSFLMGFCLEGLANDATIKKLTHKSGSTALLEVSEEKEKRKFPHTEVQYYFLGKALLELLSKRTIPNILRRTILSSEHLDVFSEVISSEKNASEAIKYLYSSLNSDNSNDSLPTNAGAIVILAFSLDLIERIDYIRTNDATFAGGSPTGIIHDAEISRLDICGADISGVTFEKVNIGTLVVDDLTKFGNSLPDFQALDIRGSDPQTIRSKEAILQFIDNHKSINTNDTTKDHPAIKLLERIVRKLLRFGYLRDSEDDERVLLLKDTYWPIIKEVLQKHERLEIKEGKAMHGRPAPLIRIKNLMPLLDADNESTKLIFQDIIFASINIKK
ncbi:hypothetical protein OU800_07085 [Pseudomonas sp. GOM7]|uniref:hypothetical protein n=1 Tax=Pseudomonas sp. GOM7 TaxID=2998079 RepID=UPI00227D2A9B|nr:hypothetical protein [Pseudomonas sp. GOM7]WAJ38983.1 hypothetical protein OU800_07085 [Pseudomonas sp. GOM7]